MKTDIEKRTIKAMIKIYCRNNHGTLTLCYDCEELMQYAFIRIEHCPFRNDKPACNKCKVHCYRAEKRENVKEVMQFSVRKMPLRHPYLTILHLLK